MPLFQFTNFVREYICIEAPTEDAAKELYANMSFAEMVKLTEREIYDWRCEEV